jgi:hypothetical protein
LFEGLKQMAQNPPPDWEDLFKQQQVLEQCLFVIEKNFMELKSSIIRKQDAIKVAMAAHQVEEAGKLKNLGDLLSTIMNQMH